MMLTISTKTQYGLLAMFEIAKNYGKELVQIADITRSRNIPENYLVQILNRLTKAGLIKSYRGSRGGYSLGDHPDSITLLRIVETLDGEVLLRSANGCGILDEIFRKIEIFVKKELSISLSAAYERQKILDQQILFHI